MSDTKIHEKLDKIDDRLGSIDVRLAKYNTELEIHIASHNVLKDEVLPLIRAHEQWKGAGKFLAWTATVVSIVGGLAWLWHR